MMRNLCSRWRWDVLHSRLAFGVAEGLGSSHHSAFIVSFSSTSGGGSGGGSDQEHPPPAPSPPLAFLDVPYFEGEGACDEKHLLDVYIPSAPFPRPRSRTCLFVHGGSWQRGDRRHPAVPDQLYGNVGRAFAAKGLVGIVMSYRLAPGVQHPEQVRDVARAVRWARDNVSRYGGDGNDIVLVGHSAGAHLAALCLADGRWLEGEEAGGVAIASPVSPRSSSSFSSSHSTIIAAGIGGSGSGSGSGPGDTTREVPSASATPPASLPPSATPPTSVRVLSGFVGISGVYDIPRMAGNVVGGVIARAAFGDDRRAWQRASPLHCVRAAAADAAAADVGGGGVGVDVDVGGGGGGEGADLSATRRDRAARTRRGETVETSFSDGVGESNVLSVAKTTTTATAEAGAAATAVAVAAVAAEEVYPLDSDTASRHSCPLLHTEVLLLTAASDFHLEEDADALVEALNMSRHLRRRRRCHDSEVGLDSGGGGSSDGTEVGGTKGGECGGDRTGERSTKGGGSDGKGGERVAVRTDRGVGERQRRRLRLRRREEVGNGADGGGGGGGGGEEEEEEEGPGGDYVDDRRDTFCAGGSARHVRLEGEDHVSTMVSFGEPGTTASDAVMDFILGLPPPRRALP
ncbi:unnamed protein product [Pylaiella littoralis]